VRPSRCPHQGRRGPRQLAGKENPLPFKRGYTTEDERSWLAKPGAFLIAPFGSDSRQLTVPLLPDSRQLTGSVARTHSRQLRAAPYWPDEPFTFSAILAHGLLTVKPTGRIAIMRLVATAREEMARGVVGGPPDAAERSAWRARQL
jgi:hypothetical protein